MEKHKRIEVFLDRLSRSPGYVSVADAWNGMGDILDGVEAEFAPRYADPMRMPSQDGQSFRRFEDGGVRIMLIGHHLYINANGAIGLQSHADLDHFMFTKPSTTGEAFVPRRRDG